jgi:2,3-diaminopropionate biosynthesis protein SbnB
MESVVTYAFHVVPGKAVADILARSRRRVLNLVKDVYLCHERGGTINPPSYFLRFPNEPSNRVIALPGYLGGAVDRVGIKWVSSFPDNLLLGLPRASAVLVLNDSKSGVPIACLEAAEISAARTAASAALAATALSKSAGNGRLAFIGAGVIAKTIMDYLVAAGFGFSELLVFDLNRDRAATLAEHAATLSSAPVRSVDGLAEVLECETVVCATTAGTPYIGPDTLLRPDQLLLNISLRDLAPQLLLDADNVVDDVDHCLTAQTSPHLAEQLSGSREFITGTLGAYLSGEVELSPDRPTIFSPFGLGVLDIGVGAFVLTEAHRRGTALEIPGFFGADEDES